MQAVQEKQGGARMSFSAHLERILRTVGCRFGGVWHPSMRHLAAKCAENEPQAAPFRAGISRKIALFGLETARRKC
ncbi:MAG: hypothetical protein IJV27_06305 [Prevotella sp.]|nr:hypothetical protein [Prevotella sp.]